MGKSKEKNKPLFKFKSNRARTTWQIVGTIIVIVVIAVVVIVALIAAGIKGWEYSNSNAFCANACHNVHPEESVAIQDSKHANVKCVECHMGRVGTITAMFKKAGHLKHIVPIITKSYGRPTFSESLLHSKNSCEGCHYSLSRHSDSLEEIRNYLPDETNTEKTTYFILGAGGEDPGRGLSDGSHWHVVNKVEYDASDEERQDMVWVKVTKEDGSIEEYRRAGAPEPAGGHEEEGEHAEGHVKTMDCLDCHNRMGHPFTTPEKAVNEAFADGRLSSELPYMKKELENFLDSKYGSQEEALSALDVFETQYKETYPEAEAMLGSEVDKAFEVAKDLVTRLIFYRPGVSWDQFPDNSGHTAFPGCFRCHNGKFESEEGDVIPIRCNLCHSLPVSTTGEGESPMIKTGYQDEPSSHLEPGFIFNHRILADDWCGACHGEIKYGSDDSGFCSSSACHGREWGPFSTLEAKAHVFPLTGGHAVPACYECHRGEERPSTECASCHTPPRSHFTQACDECHTPEGFVVSAAGIVAKANIITHSLDGMEECLMCHDIKEGFMPAPQDHTGYRQEQCVICHKTAGGV
jgi:hypothetical protein